VIVVLKRNSPRATARDFYLRVRERFGHHGAVTIFPR
jgi:hypothetical protein